MISRKVPKNVSGSWSTDWTVAFVMGPGPAPRIAEIPESIPTRAVPKLGTSETYTPGAVKVEATLRLDTFGRLLESINPVATILSSPPRAVNRRRYSPAGSQISWVSPASMVNMRFVPEKRAISRTLVVSNLNETEQACWRRYGISSTPGWPRSASPELSDSIRVRTTLLLRSALRVGFLANSDSCSSLRWDKTPVETDCATFVATPVRASEPQPVVSSKEVFFWIPSSGDYRPPPTPRKPQLAEAEQAV